MIKQKLDDLKIDYQSDIEIKKISRISGGKCDFFCKPKKYTELVELLKFCNSHKLQFEIIGNCTNTYFLSSYNLDIIISTINFDEVIYEEDYILCSSGCNLSSISKDCVAKGIKGYEGFIGIPGTVGAAAINNSGAFDSEMSKVVKFVEILTMNNELKKIDVPFLEYSQRDSILKRTKNFGYILRVAFDTSKKEDISILQSRVDKYKKIRKEQIDGTRKSLGSIFVSPSLIALKSNNWIFVFIKRLCYMIAKIFIKKNQRKLLNKNLDFFFLGLYRFRKNCDSLNRFCWDEKTSESDFLDYLAAMQKKAKNQLKLEIEIKGT